MMQMFEAISDAECCLCGSPDNLSGEHKIKASILRNIFGKEAMVIGHFDGASEPRLAQGPKSRALHFNAPLCGDCNAANTQPADRAFARFHEHVAGKFAAAPEAEADTERLFPVEQYPDGSPETLNVYRYFAKLLTCQIADCGGPRLPLLAAFALGRIDFNPIRLKIKADPTYQDFTQVSEELSAFAGHGGLVVDHSRSSGELSGFHSTLTLGPIQYVYWMEFNGPVTADLKAADPQFFALTREAFRKGLETPLSDHERRKLGFPPNGD
jgi:hypothetical protein